MPDPAVFASSACHCCRGRCVLRRTWRRRECATAVPPRAARARRRARATLWARGKKEVLRSLCWRQRPGGRHRRARARACVRNGCSMCVRCEPGAGAPARMAVLRVRVAMERAASGAGPEPRARACQRCGGLVQCALVCPWRAHGGALRVRAPPQARAGMPVQNGVVLCRVGRVRAATGVPASARPPRGGGARCLLRRGARARPLSGPPTRAARRPLGAPETDGLLLRGVCARLAAAGRAEPLSNRSAAV